MKRSLTIESLETAGIGAFFRPRDLVRLDISFRRLQGLVAEGVVEKVGYGLYRLVEVELTEMETVAMVACAAPRTIVCLFTALGVHGIGTQLPHEIWIALDRKARKPVGLPARVRIVRYSGAMLSYGVVRRPMLGVPVSITSPARTVVDCFRYRNKVGLDVAMEALRDSVRDSIATVDQIWRAAEVCRIRTVIGPYLEALAL